MLPATRFTDPAAVETWDTWFRWRVDGELRDVTVDDTWWRVAQAVAAAEGAQAPLWAHRFVDAFSQWRLLPDERLLQHAGTGQPVASSEPPAAVLNVAAFVHAPFGAAPCFDEMLFGETAALAVRLLDDALTTCTGFAPDAGLRIGVIGFDDALRRLGLSYLGDEARVLAAAVARTLAEGCLRGAADLADERGPGVAGDPDLATLVTTRWSRRGLSDRLLDRLRQGGVRHATLTAIQPHPLLARLANGASDGLAPHPPGHEDAGLPVPAAVHAALCAEVQPWLDLALEPPHASPLPATEYRAEAHEPPLLPV